MFWTGQESLWKLKPAAVSILFILLLGCLSTIGFAQENSKSNVIPSGFYISAARKHISFFDSDLNGKDFFLIGKESIVLPELSSATGWNIIFGTPIFTRNKVLNWYFEGLLQWSHHDGAWRGREMDVKSFLGGVGIKICLNPGRRLQPYFSSHFIVFPRIEVSGGSFIIEQRYDVRFWGSGVRLGGGLTYYLTDRLGIYAGVDIFQIWYTNLKGVKDHYNRLSDNVATRGKSIEMGLTFTFYKTSATPEPSK